MRRHLQLKGGENRSGRRTTGTERTHNNVTRRRRASSSTSCGSRVYGRPSYVRVNELIRSSDLQQLFCAVVLSRIVGACQDQTLMTRNLEGVMLPDRVATTWSGAPAQNGRGWFEFYRSSVRHLIMVGLSPTATLAHVPENCRQLRSYAKPGNSRSKPHNATPSSPR